MASRGVITPPARRPSLVNLLTSVLTPDQQAATGAVGQRWQMGWSFRPDVCGFGGVADICDPGSLTIDYTRGAEIEGEPFLVWTGYRCSSLGWQDARDRTRAQEQLLVIQSSLIAAELWSGALAEDAGYPNQRLNDSSSDTLSDGPTSIANSLACLEQAIATCAGGARGMIHATPQLASRWLQAQAVTREGGILVTGLGTIVVPDGGYDGSGPGGVPAGATQWAYATGLVTVELGAIDVYPDDPTQALIRSTNSFEYRAMRPAAALWDGCCHFAVEVDLELCAFGGS